MPEPLFDRVPGWLVLIGTVALFVTVNAMGRRLARWRQPSPIDEDQKSHAGVLLAALLALLGLLLAFSFSIAEARFVERRQLVLEEANAIGTTYLRASFLPPPHRDEVQTLLRQYVELRRAATPEELPMALERSQTLHRALWAEAIASSEQKPDPITALFVQSLNQMLDLHESRVTVALHQRMPKAILLSLYLVAILAMATLGYGTGLGRTRATLPALAVMVAVAIVLLLVIDLDRPFQRVFQVDQAALDDVRETVSRGAQADSAKSRAVSCEPRAPRPVSVRHASPPGRPVCHPACT